MIAVWHCSLPVCQTATEHPFQQGTGYRSSGKRVAHCMQEQVRVSSTERIVVSSPCSVTLRSSTSTCGQGRGFSRAGCIWWWCEAAVGTRLGRSEQWQCAVCLVGCAAYS